MKKNYVSEILYVRVRKSDIEVTYHKRDEYSPVYHRTYKVAPNNVFEFMMSHECKTLKNGDFLYSYK